jgi:hypothetical protein
MPNEHMVACIRPSPSFYAGPSNSDCRLRTVGFQPPNLIADLQLHQSGHTGTGFFGRTLEFELPSTSFLATPNSVVNLSGDVAQIPNSSNPPRGRFINPLAVINSCSEPTDHVSSRTLWSYSDPDTPLPLSDLDNPIGAFVTNCGISGHDLDVSWQQDLTVPLSSGVFKTLSVNDYVGLESDTSSHVFGFPLMNGGLLPRTDCFQFADNGNLGHELSFPEQVCKVSPMGATCGIAVDWLTLLLLTMYKPPIQPMHPTLFPSCLLLFFAATPPANKRSREPGTGLAMSRAFISRVQGCTCAPLLDAQRATERDTVVQTR